MSVTILISEIHPNQESGSEWVEFYITPEPAEDFSLNNFTIFDNLRQIYKFTNEKFVNQLLVVEVSGLNNDTDSVILKDDNGEILDTFTYDKTEKGLSWSRNFADNTFALTAPSRNLMNPSPTPTVTPSLTATPTTLTPTATVTVATTTITTELNENTDVTDSTSITTNTVTQNLINLDKIKLSSRDQNQQNRNLRLVFLGELPERNLIINAIIGSFLIILASMIFIYGKIKNQYRS